MSKQLEISAGQFSDRGRKEENQDFHGLMYPQAQQRKTKGIAIAIADGISSSEYGKEASEACVTGFLSDYFSTPESWSVKKSVQQVLTALNGWLHGQGRLQGQPQRGRVSTLSAIVFKSTTAHIVHIGDSRIHRLRDGELEQLTEDHRTWVSQDKNYLCRAMGADTHLEIDYRKLPVRQGDVFILTTDGVHDYLDEDEMTRLLLDNQDDLERAAELIVRRAYQRESPDNLSCQVLRVDSLPSQDPDDVFQELTELPFPPALCEGMIIDGYRIVREIHATARTQLYLALDSETGLRVVLKTPSVNFEDDPAYIERFILEEWIGRRIDSPHVVKVYAPSRHRRFLYHVTEYIEGQTLRQWMRDHPRAPLEAVRGLVEQIARGLRAFHRLEMLHQDLKPENIMIDATGTVKIVDFGSTKVAGIAEIETPVVRSNLLGTKNYTAPEYALDRPGSARSDLFSLAVICYEMLTGALPYGAMPGNWKHEDPLRGRSYRLARNLNAEIPAWVDGALQKAVAVDPRRRHEELSEFLYDLRHPNPQLMPDRRRPLLERNPLRFWQGLNLLQFTLLLYLFYRLVH